jgi:NCS1 family nucleobase:cation symporter-1
MAGTERLGTDDETRGGGPSVLPRQGQFDATVTDLPLMRVERIWNFWQHSAVNVGLAIATWAFLQGAAVAYYVGVKQAIAAMIIGYGISVLLVALAPCMPSVKHGIEQFVGIRSTFGERGARIFMILVSTLLAAAWSAVLAIMFGHGLKLVLRPACSDSSRSSFPGRSWPGDRFRWRPYVAPSHRC